MFTAPAAGPVCGHHLADDQPVEQHPHGGELLLHVRRRMGLLAGLYIGTDVIGPDCSEDAERVGVGPRRVFGLRLFEVKKSM